MLKSQCSVLLLALAVSANSAPLDIVAGSRFDFSLPASPEAPLSSDGLSGIAYLGSDVYLLVSDSAPRLRRLRVEMDSDRRRIVAVHPLPDVVLADEEGLPLDAPQFGDREDLALAPDRKTVWVVNERCGGPDRGPCLERFRLADGRRLALVRPAPDSPLGDFEDMESNRGFESLVADPTGGYWAGLERPLPVDRSGPDPSADDPSADDPSAGDPWSGPIRLQHLSGDDRPRPLQQIAFLSDPPHFGAAESEPWQRFYGSRLVALLAPPGQPLIAVLSLFQEGTDGYPETLIRFYSLDRAAEDDVSRPPFATALSGRTFRPAEKRLIGELRFHDTESNFEGAALGPLLENDDWVVLLVRDNDQGVDQSLYSVRLRPSSE